MTKCPSCGRESPDSATHCVGCSAALPTPDSSMVTELPRVSPGDDETRMSPTHAHLTASGGGIGTISGLTPGQTFGHRYQVINLLGAGGMGAVYHVWDAELGMSVALKVIRPDTDPSSAHDLERRFKRE